MNLGGFPERIWRSRPGRAGALAAILVLLATITRPGPVPPPPGAGTGRMTAIPVRLDPARPADRRAGHLEFLAGWALSSRDGRFGGISAMHIDQGAVTALADVGMLIRFAVPAAAGGSEAVRFDPLIAGPGPRAVKGNRDTESLVISGNALWAGFERHNMIWRYRLDTLAPLSAARPPAMRRWRSNRGPEAIARLAGGRFLVFAEGDDDGSPQSEALLFAGDAAIPGTASTRLTYRRPAGFRATDAAALRDGAIMVLNRRFRIFEGWSARLVIARIGQGGTVSGPEIAALAPPLTVDNMEALAVTREGGRTIVWLASDDNFSPLQRTLLLKFALVE
jgi:hypothetical protein